MERGTAARRPGRALAADKEQKPENPGRTVGRVAGRENAAYENGESESLGQAAGRAVGRENAAYENGESENTGRATGQGVGQAVSRENTAYENGESESLSQAAGRAAMPYVFLGNTGLRISRAGFGVLPMGPAQLALPLEQGAALLTYALAHGFNFFDTTQYYQTYPYLRRALEAWDRTGHGGLQAPPPVICSKSLAKDAAGMDAAIEEARQALNRDVIDIFLLHEVRGGQLALRTGALEALVRARALGRVQAIGLSTHHASVALAAASIAELDVVFPLLNYAGLGIRTEASSQTAGAPAGCRGDTAPLPAACSYNKAGRSAAGRDSFQTGRPATAADMLDAIHACKTAGKGVFSMKAFGGGSLTATYQKSLDFVFGQADVDAVMIGFGRISEIDDLLAYLSGAMPPSYQPDISHKRTHINQEDCLGCGACKAACPAGAIHWNESGLASIDESRCLTCGYCAPVCPVRAVLLY